MMHKINAILLCRHLGCHTKPPITDFSIQWGDDTSKMGARGANLWSTDQKWWQNGPNFVQEAAWWIPMSVPRKWALLKSVCLFNKIFQYKLLPHICTMPLSNTIYLFKKKVQAVEHCYVAIFVTSQIQTLSHRIRIPSFKFECLLSKSTI